MKKFTLLLFSLTLLLVVKLPAQYCATFDHFSPGAIFGSTAGHVPGDIILLENGITMAVDSFRWTDSTGAFQSCQLMPAAPSFSSSPYLALNNINLLFDFSPLEMFVFELKLVYRNQGGFDNIQVNGGPLHILPLSEMPSEVAPGVAAFPTTGADNEVLTLTGPVSTLLIGGQELLLDDVCIRAIPYEGGTYCFDFDTLEVGMQFGGPAGHTPGELVLFPFQFDVAAVVDSFFLAPDAGAFNLCTVVNNNPEFSNNPHMLLSNIGITFFSPLTIYPPYQMSGLTMKYHSLGGVENLSINWQLPYIGPLDDIPWDYFPDVVISHHFGQEANYLTLDGNLLAVSIGGQELLLDDVCTGPLTDVEGPVVSEGPTVVLFPNPVTSGAPLLIKVEEPSFSDISFELFDAQGRRVGAMISVEGKLAEIPTEGLPMGLYFFRMSNDGITLHAGKLVIQ